MITIDHPQALKRAVDVIRRGGVIAYPTETSYGLGADPWQKRAVQRLYQMKRRPRRLFLPLIASSLAMVRKWCHLDRVSLDLAKKYWPGPLSLVLPLKNHSRPQKQLALILGTHTIAIRLSNMPLARSLARISGRPVIATSANITGQPSLYSARAVYQAFSRRKFRPDLILDGGTLPIRPASTVVQVVDKKLIILRQGELRIPPF